MRDGDWRAIFEIMDDEIIMYRIFHRKEAYE